MPLQVSPLGDSGSRIQISGRFDFALHRDFREAYRNQAQSGHVFRVNLAQAQYMDSSALGMLLLLKEHADTLRGKVVIEAPPLAIRRILEVASFDKVFSIEA